MLSVSACRICLQARCMRYYSVNGNNVKGRDWYDMEWYIKKGVVLHLDHFLLRAKNSGDWKEDSMTSEELQKLFHARIDAVDMERVKQDITRFIPYPEKLDIWSANYFHDLANYLVITN